MFFLRLNKTRFIRLEKARSHKYVSRKPDGKGGWIYTYSKKPSGNNYALNYNDVKNFGYEKAVQIHKDIELIRSIKDSEHSKIYDENGNVVLHKIFPKEGGKFSQDELKKIENSKLLIHNHPSADSFSPDDLELMLDRNIDEIRACGEKGKRKTDFSLKIIKQPPISKHKDIIKDYTNKWNSFMIMALSGILSWPAYSAMQSFTKIYKEFSKHERIK